MLSKTRNRLLAAAFALTATAAVAQHLSRTHERLAMIRGNVFEDGTVLSGAGFSVRLVTFNNNESQIADAPAYEITFARPFHHPPTITATLLGTFQRSVDPPVRYPSSGFVYVLSVDETRAVIVTEVASQSSDVRAPFGFTAVGPR